MHEIVGCDKRNRKRSRTRTISIFYLDLVNTVVGSLSIHVSTSYDDKIDLHKTIRVIDFT